MGLLDKYKTTLSKDKDISVENLEPPRYFLHSGSYSLNKLISGTLEGALPQGRLIALGGHSSSGKSLVGASAIGQVIRDGGIGIVVDSEGALDNSYLQGCGVDTDSENFLRIGTSRIQKCSSVVNKFISEYKESGETTKVVILVDSLDMLFTDSEQAKIDKEGELGGDQGQRAKQLKRMLMSWVHSISSLNITILCTKQVYQEQDQAKAYSEPWVFTSALEYAFSAIIIFEKLVFKEDKKGGEHLGFTLKARTYKNRMAREKQVVRVEIPFDQGLDPFAGLIDNAVQYGVVEVRGAWHYLDDDTKVQGKKNAEANEEFMSRVLAATMEIDSKSREVHANLDDYISESESPTTGGESAAKRRKNKALKGLEDDLDEDENG